MQPEGMLALLRSMVVMLTTLLQPKVDGQAHYYVLHLRIRIFLSCIEEFDKPLRRKTTYQYQEEGDTTNSDSRKRKKKIKISTTVTEGEPKWLEKFNFLCFLNLPEILRDFGPAQNYFEGKYLGERYVQEVKTTRQKCPPKNVCPVLLGKLHQVKSLEAMVDLQPNNLQTYRSTEAKNKKRKELSGNVRIYSTISLALREFYSGKPISVVETEVQEYAILYYLNGCNRGNVGCRMVSRMEESNTIVQNGVKYWKWELLGGVEFEELNIRDYGVLLPKIGGEGIPIGGGYFTIVTKEWSPMMLEHFEYCQVGMYVKPEMEEKPNFMIEEGWL
jgi:hypothetical protein